MAAKYPQGNFIRCHAALDALLSHTIPSLQHALDTWHQKIKDTTKPCSNPTQCPAYQKPSTKNNSCLECIAWVAAIEAQVYPPSAAGSLQWMNANPTLFCKDPLEVIKLFVLQIPANQRNAYSSLGDFDTASLLMIMGNFKEFHHGDREVFDMIQKVAQTRNSLAQLKHAKKLNLDDETFSKYWKDVIDLVNSLPETGNTYFTKKSTRDVVIELCKIKDQAISLKMTEAALKPLREDIVLKTIQDISDQEASNILVSYYAVKPTDSDLMLLIRLLDIAERYELYQALNMSQHDIETAEANSPPYTGVDIRAKAVLAKWREFNSKMATQQALLDGLERCGNIEAKENVEDIWSGKDSLEDMNKRSASEKSEMYEIIKPLVSEELLRLYQSLDMSPADVERAEGRVSSSDVHQRARSVIRWWKKRNGRKATYVVLQAAAKRCKYMQRKSTPELSTDQSTWQKQLQALYRIKRSGIGFLPGSFEEFPSDEYFVDLQLEKEQKTPTQVTYVDLETYTDLLTLSDEKGTNLKHVLVSGLAGMGKTTMMSRLAFQWTSMNLIHQPNDPLHIFQQVFLIDLRKTTPDMDLLDAICGQLLGNVSRHKLEEYLTENADKCLYLFDGFDELSAMNRILKSRLIYDSPVIVTTRPIKVTRFYELHRHFVQVNMEGFTEESIELFIRNYFRSSPETSSSKATELLVEIGSNYVIDNLKHFPLLLGMVCFIWREKQSLPLTVSHLYHQVIEYLLRHWKSREAEESSAFSSEEFKAHVQLDQVMVSIGKIALHGLLNDSKLVFNEDEFDSSEVIKQSCSLGILSTESKISGFDMITYVSFIHKTFQEYAAALYLASLANTDETMFKTLLSQMDFDDMEYVLRFCCGRSQQAAELILTYVVLVSKENVEPAELCRPTIDRNDSCRMPLVLLFEAEYTFGVKRALHIILRPAVHTINMYFVGGYQLYFHYDPVYVSALKYFISKFEMQHEWINHVKMVTIHTESKTIIPQSKLALESSLHEEQKELLKKIMQCKKVTLGVVYLGSIYQITYETGDLQTLSEHADRLLCPVDELILTKFVTCNTINNYLHQTPRPATLHLACINIDDKTNPETVAFVLQTIHSRSGSVRGLTARHNSVINDDLIKHLAPFYSMMRSIELYHVNSLQQGVDTMFENMSQAGKFPLLEELGLSDNSINSGRAKALAVLLKHMPKLRELGLDNNELGCEGVIALSESLQYTTQLEVIDLENNDIGCDGVTSLATVLHYNTKLRDLRLGKNKIKCDGAKAIASALESNGNLKELHLSYNQIQCDGAKAIASALESNTSLLQLGLSNNQIQCDGAKAFASVLSSNTSLNWLDMEENQIKSDGAKSLAATLQSSRVKDFYLRGNQIGADEAEALCSAAEDAGISLFI